MIIQKKSNMSRHITRQKFLFESIKRIDLEIKYIEGVLTNTSGPNNDLINELSQLKELKNRYESNTSISDTSSFR